MTLLAKPNVAGPRLNLHFAHIERGVRLATVTLSFTVLPCFGLAQEFTRTPIGQSSELRHMIDPIGSDRDEQGNLVQATIDDIDTGGSVTCGVGATAYGNLISVTIEGNGNSVVIDAIQNNSGNITAIADLNSGSLEGC